MSSRQPPHLPKYGRLGSQRVVSPRGKANVFKVRYADLAQRLENAVAAAATATNSGSAPAALAATHAVTPANAALPPATARKANRVLPQGVDWASVPLLYQISAVTPPPRGARLT